MKRNHIAIAGILASVLVTMDAAWADTGTVIASQAYVDAKVGTKLNSSALNAGTLSTTSTTTVPSEKTVSDAISDAISDALSDVASVDDGTGSNNALELTSSSTKAPSVRAVQAMKSTSNLATVSDGVVSISAGSDTALPTTKAVADTIKTLDHKTATASSNATTAVTAVSQADGQVTVTNGTLAAAAIGQKVTSDLLSSTSTGYIPTVAAVQGAVTYVNNTASENKHTATVNVSEVPAAVDVFTRNTTIKAKGDDFVPTVAAVEARVKAVEVLIPTVPVTTDTKSATYDSTAHTLTVATTGDGASTTKTATPKQVANTITDVQSYIDYKDSLKANSADLGDLATLDAVGSAQITDGAIVNADISTSANIAYTKMDGTLKDVNSDSTNASCTAASPCVLTYYKIGSTVYYKWTNLIETDGVTALPAS